MKGARWIVILLAATLIAACFFPWVTISSRQFVISGFHSTIDDFGKPGIVHVFLCTFYIFFILLYKKWSLRAAFFISTVNIAWAARNFFIISACRGGTCPDKQPALYVIIAGSVLLTILTLALSVKEKE